MNDVHQYVVAATPRTGSSLLCEGLTATGIAGCPGEFFAPMTRSNWCDYFRLSRSAAFGEFYAAALRHGSAAGVFGLKIQWMHVQLLAREAGMHADSDVLSKLFPQASFINIIRRDVRAQAISWFRAIHTREWWRFRDALHTPPEPSFDPDAVRALERDIACQQAAWTHYFENRGLRILVVEYEELERDYAGQIARVLSFLQLDSARAAPLPAPRLVRQSDAVSRRWHSLMEMPIQSDEAPP